ncbi:MAG: hypothetical protein HY814_04770 [Candidatus Riflebacteria bacterium]|nr:hypothetical protein [Candidatus Riflebacteria bacterium]
MNPADNGTGRRLSWVGLAALAGAVLLSSGCLGGKPQALPKTGEVSAANPVKPARVVSTNDPAAADASIGTTAAAGAQRLVPEGPAKALEAAGRAERTARMELDNIGQRCSQLQVTIDTALHENPPNKEEAANLQRELAELKSQLEAAGQRLAAAQAETARLKGELQKLPGGGTLGTSPK